MGYLSLLVALLLPWLGGYFWLAAVENRFDRDQPDRLRQIGYGLFIGYAGLQAFVLGGNALTGTVAFWPTFSVVALVTAIGAGLFALSRSRKGTHDPAPAPALLPPRLARILLWTFAAWTALHLLFVAVEIIHRPVFPWDAWYNWIYRAKAWFYSGQIAPMDHPTEWLRGSGQDLYNVVGNHYPTFSPVLALWSASALGYWSETLVNLPVLFCGLALGLALYGQCREFGLEKWLSGTGVYLLLSLPLIGAHLSLAGQADIWMTGFAGLGFVALLHGIIRDRQLQRLLGLGMVAMGIAVKMEGAVWFLAALLTLALARRMGITLACLALAAAIALLGWLIGVTYLELPLLGGIGLAEGRVHIPLLGNYALQDFDLWDDYRENFFSGGTWHLLWTLVPLGVISLWWAPAGKLRRTIAVFYCVVLAAQLFIFEGTESGQWAEDWTAINRLPLHFAPPLIFSLLILAQTFTPPQQGASPPAPALRVPVLGLIIAFGSAVVYLLLAYPGSGADPRAFSAQDMRIVVGDGRVKGDVGVIERYENNIAILSSGRVQLDAEQFGLLRVETAGPNKNRATFFWRNGNRPEDLHSTEISGRGTRLLNLDQLPQWRGVLSEIGVIFYSDGGKPAAFHGLQLTPHSLPLQLNKLAHDWSETSLWSQKSVHWLPAGAVQSSLPLPLLMSAWVLAALLATLVIARRTPGARAAALLCALAGWVVLDLRWTFNNLVQAGATIRTFPMLSASYLDFGDDEFTRQLVDATRPETRDGHSRTIIMGEDQSMRFQVLRAKYHALPAATYVHEGPVEQIPAQIADYLLVMKKRYAEPGHTAATPAEYARVINRRTGVKAVTVWDKPEGFMLSLTDPEKPD